MGTKTLGTKTLGTKTLGTKTLGTKTLGTKTLGTKTLGTKTLGTKTKATTNEVARRADLAPRDLEVKRALDRVRAECDGRITRDRDPVGFVHRYRDPLDQEIVGLLAACVAFGNVKAIRAKLEDALARLGPRPHETGDDESRLFAAMDGWIHRVYRGEDVARLVLGARRVQRAHGTLGARFASDLRAHGRLRPALSAFCAAIRSEGGFPLRKLEKGERRGPAHLLPDPEGGSGSKRILLYLRWMVRPADGVDLGLWPVSPDVLLCPVDVHIHKLARNLGLSRRKNLSWETTVEITAALSRFDAEDPVKYDFSLCHMGMLQRCPSRRDAARCEGCGVLPVCRFWRGEKQKAARSQGKERRSLIR